MPPLQRRPSFARQVCCPNFPIGECLREAFCLRQGRGFRVGSVTRQAWLVEPFVDFRFGSLLWIALQEMFAQIRCERVGGDTLKREMTKVSLQKGVKNLTAINIF